ncbi:MAG: exodeoxyribonuclease VII large subunit [Pseudobdellovibrionaceae bacterium]|nr:MAG: exodeoxyribonuclease VII large subunit [Pseudobdellovibrionaceae bacterium]
MGFSDWANEEPEDNQPVANEPHVFSVSELNGSVREILESQFSLIWLQGEISNFKAHTSGHFYFSLKDDKAQVNAVMFRGFNSRLKFRPESGMEVLVRGKITVYEPRGNYQVFCETMEPVGAGALQKAFEQLKAKLQKEGLFAKERKKPLPAFPKHIAVVTSPTGAAIRDILNVLKRRHRGAEVTVVPALVQGPTAAASIVKGIEAANKIKNIDVIIVGRGGGSIEDLWCFNEESVARAIVASQKPIISAVGHEVDFTISDFVADLRAPTPSAAAELVVKNSEDLLERIKQIRHRLLRSMNFIIHHHRQRLTHLGKRLIDPQRRLQDLSMRCDELTQRLELSVERFVSLKRQQLQHLLKRLGTPLALVDRQRQRVAMLGLRLASSQKQILQDRRHHLKELMAVLDSLSPLKVVDRGYSIVTKQKVVVKNVEQLSVGDSLHVRLAHGGAQVSVTTLEKE